MVGSRKAHPILTLIEELMIDRYSRYLIDESSAKMEEFSGIPFGLLQIFNERIHSGNFWRLKLQKVDSINSRYILTHLITGGHLHSISLYTYFYALLNSIYIPNTTKTAYLFRMVLEMMRIHNMVIDNKSFSDLLEEFELLESDFEKDDDIKFYTQALAKGVEYIDYQLGELSINKFFWLAKLPDIYGIHHDNQVLWR
jgi:hypothetical protein